MKTILILIAAIFSLNAFAESKAKIDPELVSFARGEANKQIGILIVMDNLAEGLQQPTRYNQSQVLNYLRRSAYATKGKFDAFLAKTPSAKGNFVASKYYYSTLTYTAIVTPMGLRIAAQGPGVNKIYANRMIDREPVTRKLASRTEAYPYDLTDTAIDKLNATYADINGAGVVLGSVDTGVDGKHPALKGKIKLFFDGVSRKVGEPIDRDTHGTHTVGTMVGDGKDGAPMGMAPGAKMIAAGALDGYDAMLAGMEFMLDPDKDPNTKDSPRAINNSWHSGGAPDMELFYRAINSWEAAGILPVFSAGNSGPRDGSITRPKEHPSAFAIAATGPDGKIASFSSRGPAVFNGQKMEKPDMSAPGVDIISSVPGGGYEKMSGTSMAAPHVTGASALLYQVDPNLTPVQIRSIFIKSTKAVDEMGAASANRAWNKVYGLGKMDVFAAVKLAKGVSERRTGIMYENMMDNLMVSPAALQIADILNLDDGATVDPYAFPEGEQGTTWVNANELFK